MNKFLLDTNIVFYYLFTNIRERIHSYLTLNDYVLFSSLCYTELLKIIKLDIHTLASVEYSQLIHRSEYFKFVPRLDTYNEEIIQIIERYSMLRGETSKKRRKRDLSFADAELIFIAKNTDSILLTNDSYIIECCRRENVQSNNPILDLRNSIYLLEEFDCRSPNFKYL